MAGQDVMSKHLEYLVVEGDDKYNLDGLPFICTNSQIVLNILKTLVYSEYAKNHLNTLEDALNNGIIDYEAFEPTVVFDLINLVESTGININISYLNTSWTLNEVWGHLKSLSGMSEGGVFNV